MGGSHTKATKAGIALTWGPAWLACPVQLRILEAKPRSPSGRSLRQVAGGWLFQDADSLKPEQVRRHRNVANEHGGACLPLQLSAGALGGVGAP
jgi:hypothetical protein